MHNALDYYIVLLNESLPVFWCAARLHADGFLVMQAVRNGKQQTHLGQQADEGRAGAGLGPGGVHGERDAVHEALPQRVRNAVRRRDQRAVLSPRLRPSPLQPAAKIRLVSRNPQHANME